MRKHRLFGVVIAVFAGTGALTHRSDTAQRTTGTNRAGMQLTSAELSADQAQAIAHGTTVHGASIHSTSGNGTAVDSAFVNSAVSAAGHIASSAPPNVLERLETDNRGAILPFPFGAVQVVTDYQAAAAQKQSEVNAYLASVAQEHAAVNAYLASVARQRAAEEAYLASVAPRVVAPPPAPRPASRPAPGNPWPALRQCESGGNYSDNTGNGYYGAYQFTLGTWESLGQRSLPSQASAAQQDQAAQQLEARGGWGQWPSCARRLGLL